MSEILIYRVCRWRKCRHTFSQPKPRQRGGPGRVFCSHACAQAQRRESNKLYARRVREKSREQKKLGETTGEVGSLSSSVCDCGNYKQPGAVECATCANLPSVGDVLHVVFERQHDGR